MKNYMRMHFGSIHKKYVPKPEIRPIICQPTILVDIVRKNRGNIGADYPLCMNVNGPHQHQTNLSDVIQQNQSISTIVQYKHFLSHPYQLLQLST